MPHYLRTLTTVVLLTISSVAGQDQPEVPSLTVSGEAEVQVEPDRAMIRLGVVARERNAAEAQRQANLIINKTVAAVENLGVDRDSLQTSELRLNPIYEDSRGPRSEPPRIIGYEAGYTISVTLHELDRVGPVVDAGLEAGANRLEGISFSLQDDAATRRKALAEATRAALEKARVLAETAGVELVRVLSINEGHVQTRMPQMFARSAAMEQADATTVLPGQLTVSASVNLRYQIRDRD